MTYISVPKINTLSNLSLVRTKTNFLYNVKNMIADKTTLFWKDYLFHLLAFYVSQKRNVTFTSKFQMLVLCTEKIKNVLVILLCYFCHCYWHPAVINAVLPTKSHALF